MVGGKGGRWVSITTWGSLNGDFFAFLRLIPQDHALKSKSERFIVSGRWIPLTRSATETSRGEW